MSAKPIRRVTRIVTEGAWEGGTGPQFPFAYLACGHKKMLIGGRWDRRPDPKTLTCGPCAYREVPRG